LNVQLQRYFEEIIDKYKDMVYRIAFTYCKNPHDAEDITQEVFLTYITSYDDTLHGEKLKAWLITVTSNKCKNLLKSSWFTKTTPLDDTLQFQESQDHELYQAVMSLPKNYRVVMYLFYYEDYSTKEIAQMLGKNESTVRSHLARARKKLKNILVEEWNDD
jgi:RNA polymerase sigma-70 factor (ECF subfamily)